MLRSFTAFNLLLVMMVATATAHPGLRWCHCLETIFVGECPCPPPVVASESTVCECGGCCESEPEESTECPLEAGDDCTSNLILELQDFVATSSIELNGNGSVDADSSENPAIENVYLISPVFSLATSPRGSPPPGIFDMPPSVPLYLRHEVILV